MHQDTEVSLRRLRLYRTSLENQLRYVSMAGNDTTRERQAQASLRESVSKLSATVEQRFSDAARRANGLAASLLPNLIFESSGYGRTRIIRISGVSIKEFLAELERFWNATTNQILTIARWE